ncbi:hypothetical protein H2Y56_21975 [Pectobacterium aroidearum]|uniref:Uncharacterized protein n=1 Tax=Pectobacterium aroidearum TaxID=1201031 RepID=A0ABR5ZJU5_9GAMM|nr:hypothetical protein [Pectobacterium aroidearum]MBA5234752.1 hypothetical protein [Pectobacterium aroidearum]MBA5739931.1 hypothetical protein [Pectobacterium aroidearum]
MAAFELADRWGEPDPRKILELPADIFEHWLAFFSLKNSESDPEHPTVGKPSAAVAREKTDEELFADNMRIIGNG